jgi:hypothetical protein
MALGKCWYCNNWLYANDNGEYEDTTRRSTYCPGNADDLHRPAEASDYIGEMKRYLNRNKKASIAAYCAGCQNIFPSAMGFPHTQSGDTLMYCPRCADNGEVFGEQNGFSVSAASPSLNLSCDNCKEEIDPGDDNETDLFGGVGEVCPNCNKGKLKMANSPGMTTQDKFENASAISSGMTPDIFNDTKNDIQDTTYSDMQRAIDAPRSYKPPRDMTREQVNGLDKNGDGIYPRSHKIASYEDIRKHLIEHHGFKNDWLRGYNQKDLMKVYDASHAHGAYAVDHGSSISDYEHGNIITSSQLTNLINYKEEFYH